MAEFRYQLIRLTWVIESHRVDQYDQRINGNNAETIVHGTYSSYEEAHSHLDDFTVTWGWQNSRRKPKEATDKYWNSQVTRRDEIIIDSHRAEVALAAMGLRE